MCLLTAGEDKGPGLVLLSGSEGAVQDLGPRYVNNVLRESTLCVRKFHWTRTSVLYEWEKWTVLWPMLLSYLMQLVHCVYARLRLWTDFRLWANYLNRSRKCLLLLL